MMTDLVAATTIEEDIRVLLQGVTRLRVPAAGLAALDDLYAAGLSSLATVDLMLAIEDHFDIEFTTAWLNRRTFATIASLGIAVRALREHAS